MPINLRVRAQCIEIGVIADARQYRHDHFQLQLANSQNARSR